MSRQWVGKSMPWVVLLASDAERLKSENLDLGVIGGGLYGCWIVTINQDCADDILSVLPGALKAGIDRYSGMYEIFISTPSQESIRSALESSGKFIFPD